MGDAERIRRLAARDLEPDEIAARLKLRPALVRRVLGRSAQRGAPRMRGTGATLSFATSPQTAARLRERAAEQGVSLSHFIDQTVQAALREGESRRPRRRKSSSEPRVRRSLTTPKRPRESNPEAAPRTSTDVIPKTAADAPESVQRLLKSYELAELHWEEKNDRHAMIVAILTRGDTEAKRWLWSVSTRKEVRELVREYRGGTCAEPDRVRLRNQLRLTTNDIPTRPYLGMGEDDAR
jgi:hypothetical protein